MIKNNKNHTRKTKKVLKGGNKSSVKRKERALESAKSFGTPAFGPIKGPLVEVC